MLSHIISGWWMPSDSNVLLCAYLQYPNFHNTLYRFCNKGIKNKLTLHRREMPGWREGWLVAEITRPSKSTNTSQLWPTKPTNLSMKISVEPDYFSPWGLRNHKDAHTGLLLRRVNSWGVPTVLSFMRREGGWWWVRKQAWIRGTIMCQMPC